MGKSSLQFKAIFAYKMANWHKFDFMRIVSGHPLYLKLVLQICDCTKKYSTLVKSVVIAVKNRTILWYM